MQIRLARNDDGAAEIFRSLQGEGPMAGRARTFVRLSGCNLHCVWCDTAYTWNWMGSSFAHERDKPGAPHKFDPAAEMIKLDLEAAAQAVRALPAEGVVITGGEPLMQREAVGALIDVLKRAAPALRIEMETNGAIAPGPLADVVDLFVVSPKLAHSGNEAALALKQAALAEFARLESTVFKFVARAPADVAEAAALARDLGVEPARVYIMAEGVDVETLDARAPMLIEAARAHGFHYTDRLHVRRYGARRGV